MTDKNNWDDAFANMAHVPNSDRLPDVWAKRAMAYRSAQEPGRFEEGISYGDGERQQLDILWPESVAQGLAVFVHGGYWMRLDKSYWTDLAEGARARGWAVCIPSYTLTPQVRITAITAELGRAINMVAARVDGPICLAGHSAGGHLVTRMLCDDSPLVKAVRLRILHTLSISGLHDLRPLMHTQMNETLRLDNEEARAESPVLHAPGLSCPLTCWVGGGERPEFIRQARLMAMMWRGLDVSTVCHIDGKHNHFTILEGLKDAQSAITDAFLGSSPSKGVQT